MKKIYVFLLILILVAMNRGTSWARALDVEATDAALIKPSVGSEEPRFLVKFALPDVLEGRSVDFACVSFKADCVGTDGRVSFQAFRVTRNWSSGTVDWTNPWEKVGGDWNIHSSAYSISEAGNGTSMDLDVTDFVNGWLKEPSGNFGIIVKVSGPFLGNFSSIKSYELPRMKILY